MILHFAADAWTTVLPVLLRVWPEPGTRWTKANAKLLGTVVKRYGADEELPSVEIEWSENGYRLEAALTGRKTTLLFNHEFIKLVEYSLVGIFEEDEEY